MWQPGWEGSLGENGYMCMYGWVPSLSTWNYDNIVNRLYPNTKYLVFFFLIYFNEQNRQKSISEVLFSWRHERSKEMITWTSIAYGKCLEELLLSRFSRVWLCATPEMAAHQAPCPWDSPGKSTGVGCHFLLQCMKVKSESEVAQSCPTLSDPMDCRLPGSSDHGIFQARVLEWGAIAFSKDPEVSVYLGLWGGQRVWSPVKLGD